MAQPSPKKFLTLKWSKIIICLLSTSLSLNPWCTHYKFAAFSLTLDQCFSTFFNSQNLWNINGYLVESKCSKNSTLNSIFREPSRESTELLCAAEPGLKNTTLDRYTHFLFQFMLSRATDEEILEGNWNIPTLYVNKIFWKSYCNKKNSENLIEKNVIIIHKRTISNCI